jgi:transcription elongation factor Elf1
MTATIKDQYFCDWCGELLSVDVSTTIKTKNGFLCCCASCASQVEAEHALYYQGGK